MTTAVQQLTLEDLPHPQEYLGSMGALCLLNMCLCWEHYGYEYEMGGPPPHASDMLTQAKRAAAIARPADCRYTIELHKIGGEVSGTFQVWDEANPWAEPWTVGFRYHSEEAARANYAREFTNHKRWQEQGMASLIQYRETGIPTLPDGQRYWEKPGYDPAKRVHLREGQPGVICNEQIPAGDSALYPHMIHVVIQPCRVDEWRAECYAERQGQKREVRATFLKGRTYEEARELGERWIVEIARPFIAEVQDCQPTERR